MTNGKQKGKAGELELVSKLKEYGYTTRRSVQYCGKAEEGQADLIGLNGVHIECKRVERLNIYDAISQAKHDAKEGEVPTVFHRKNRCQWLVTMTLDDYMKLYRVWEGEKDEFRKSSSRDSK